MVFSVRLDEQVNKYIHESISVKVVKCEGGFDHHISFCGVFFSNQAIFVVEKAICLGHTIFTNAWLIITLAKLQFINLLLEKAEMIF